MGFLLVNQSALTTVVNVETAVTSSWFPVDKCDRIAFLINVTKTLSPGNLTLTLEGSSDSGTTAITLDFEDGGGMGASEVYTATADDLIWLKPGAVMPWIRVSLISAATTNATNYWTPKIWIAGYHQ